VDEEGLALEDIREAGRSGDFLNSPHTLQHFRHVLSRAQLALRVRRGDWEANGSHTFEESVEERVRDILSREPKHYLDPHQQAELERLERAAMAANAPQ
jgi:trimethylamine:corrinoid methyltransferase-like protein